MASKKTKKKDLSFMEKAEKMAKDAKKKAKEIAKAVSESSVMKRPGTEAAKIGKNNGKAKRNKKLEAISKSFRGR